MELVSSICAVLCALFFFATLIFLVIWLVRCAKKSPKRERSMYLFISFITSFFTTIVIGVSTIPKCDHNWEIIEQIEASCTENGQTIVYCPLCDEQKIEEEKSIGHTWVENTKSATCIEDGEISKTCSTCGFAEIDVIPASGHTWEDFTSATPKTCSTCGFTEPEPAEILFREIPWGTTSKEAEKILEDSEIDAYASIWAESLILYPESLISPYPSDGVPGGGNVVYAHHLTAGGYPVSIAQLHFAYSIINDSIDRNNDYFYSAVYHLDVVEDEAVYNDLLQKMNTIYGEGEELTGTLSGYLASPDYNGKYKHTVTRTTWYGANNTFVTLQWIFDDNPAESIQNSCGVSIVYGKTDADLLLKDIEKALNAEKAAADRENAHGNNVGL